MFIPNPITMVLSFSIPFLSSSSSSSNTTTTLSESSTRTLKLDRLAITVPISSEKLQEIKGHFSQVHYYPKAAQEDHIVPKDIAGLVDVWYSNAGGIPNEFDLADLGNTKLIQLSSAGANKALLSPALSNPNASKQIILSSASGIHALSIPPWIIAQIINLYKSIHIQTFNLRTEKKWIRDVDGTPSRSLYGKTAGLLGYGHIARETARLLKVFNVNVIAATSNGERRVDEGYIIPHTGDQNGTIPSEYYSTTDKDSFKEFLSKSDILISTLPSTPQTQFMLNKELFALLPKDAVFVNIGRGDLVHSEDILAALEEGSLSGVALDVTDPEPLTDNHPLFTHPSVTITPHTSAAIEGYFDAGADLLIANVKRIRDGGKPFNKVDPEKGY